MFPVGGAYCILATKFACSIFFFGQVPEKMKFQMIFDLNMLKKSVNVYVVNQIFEAVCDLLVK